MVSTSLVRIFLRAALSSRRQFLVAVLGAFIALPAASRPADAAIIVGPATLPNSGSGDTNWGIEFVALQNTTLTGFDYFHLPDTFAPNPFKGTITLTDITTLTPVYTTPYGPGTATVINFSGLSVALTAGDKYQLLATSDTVDGAIDEKFQYISLDAPPFTYPVSNSDISVTSGVFSGVDTGFQAENAWASFKNITTQVAVPEPASFASFLLVAGVVAGQFGWRRRKQAAVA